MSEWYFNPIIFEIGPFKAHWYGFMYALSFILGYLYITYSKPAKKLKLKQEDKDTFAISVILGIILGGRLGYIIFYNFFFYLYNPVKIFAVWEGGMSFHGGLIGVVIAILLFLRKRKIKLFSLSDVLTSYIPLGVFFVRIANFINGELYGKVANSFCLHFPSDPNNCRYPSQLLQAFLEGLVLFAILQFLIHKKDLKTGTISGLFLILYGSFRIFSEFFREPDVQIGYIGGIITQGQLLSTLMIIGGSIILYSIKKK